MLPRFIKEYAPRRRTSSITDRRRKPTFFPMACFRVAKQKGFRKDTNTANSSYIKAQDPGLTSLHSDFPQTPAQTDNIISIRMSVTIKSSEDTNDRGVNGRNESYTRLEDFGQSRQEPFAL